MTSATSQGGRVIVSCSQAARFPVEVADRDLIQRIDRRLQMPAGDMQIDGGVFQPLMSQQ